MARKITSEERLVYKKRSAFKEFLKRFVKNKPAVAAFFLLVFILTVTIAADWIVPYEMAVKNNVTSRFQPPSAQHWFGTDDLGRDIFARIIHGSKYSLLVAIAISVFSFIIGIITGAIAGYYGKKVDAFIMRIADIIFSVPIMVIALIVIAITGSGMFNMIIAFTIAMFVTYTRLIRGSILYVKNMEYIEAAKSIGCSDLRIIFKHIVPNVIGPLIIQLVMVAGGSLTMVSALSFLGLGLPQPTPEWGSMLSLGQRVLRNSPYILYIVSTVLFVTIMSFNFLGEGIRDGLDPKQKR